MFTGMKVLWMAGALLLIASACDGPCTTPPCPLPFAIIVNVTSSGTGTPVGGVFVKVSVAGAAGSSFCDQPLGTRCYVPGDAGTYQLEIGAPGFQSIQQTVRVPGSGPVKCGCSSVETQAVNVTLTPVVPSPRLLRAQHSR